MKTLIDMYKILSPSHKESDMSLYIQNHLKDIGVSFEVDRYGQVFSIKPGTPILSAHMDQVQRIAPDKIVEDDGYLYGFNKHCQVGLGADDKNGIWIILKILQEIDQDTISFIFSSGEEAGGKVGEILLSNHPYCIVLDRKGSGDIIGVSNQYCCQDFQDEVERVGQEFGYTPTTGVFSDANSISNLIPCVNISVGYYNAHTDHEYTSIKDLSNSLNFSKKMLENIERVVYKVPEKRSTLGGFSRFLGINDTSNYDEWWENYGLEQDKVEEYKEELLSNPPEIFIRDGKVYLTDSLEDIQDEKISLHIPKNGHIMEITRDNYTIILENIRNNIFAYIEIEDVYEEIECNVEEL